VGGRFDFSGGTGGADGRAKRGFHACSGSENTRTRLYGGEICHETRHHIEIVGEGWRKEAQPQLDLRVFQGHHRARGRDVAMRLLEGGKRFIGIAKIPP
jgi:hypothetical protein